MGGPKTGFFGPFLSFPGENRVFVFEKGQKVAIFWVTDYPSFCTLVDTDIIGGGLAGGGGLGSGVRAFAAKWHFWTPRGVQNGHLRGPKWLFWPFGGSKKGSFWGSGRGPRG